MRRARREIPNNPEAHRVHGVETGAPPRKAGEQTAMRTPQTRHTYLLRFYTVHDKDRGRRLNRRSLTVAGQRATLSFKLIG